MHVSRNGVKWVDFNMVLRREKMSGENFSSTWANDFKDALDRLHLVDVLLVGDQWT